MTLMLNAVPKIREPENSPFVGFEKSSVKRAELVRAIENIRSSKPETLPLWIDGPVFTKNKKGVCVPPHDYNRLLAEYSTASERHVVVAIETVLNARKMWSQIPWPFRLNIFLKAARLLETRYLVPMVAAVMEDYSKNPFEAFIDVQELIDFWNFNTWYAYTIYKSQPRSSADSFNMLDYRPLEGFVYALPPNNFVAIEGNLPTAPLIMGNVVIVKPSRDVVYSFHLVLKILLEAGLPKNVLAVLQGNSDMIGDTILAHPMLSGVHFTGGTDTFKKIRWQIAQNEYNRNLYKNFVRVVGETGGKNPIVVFDDHDPIATAAWIVIGGFGAQGRKCSATSRVYTSENMWSKLGLGPALRNLIETIKVGDVADFQNYMAASIDEREHDKIVGYIADARKYAENTCTMAIVGGENTKHGGWFIHPTVIVTTDPNYRTMQEEIFGPIVTICVLPNENYKKRVLKYCDDSPYGLTGAIHTNDVLEFCEALEELKYVAGNMYNGKTTGAMVGHQPFSGSRHSGTNSKVGWWTNLLEWVEMRTIGVTAVKPTDFAPPYLDKD